MLRKLPKIFMVSLVVIVVGMAYNTPIEAIAIILVLIAAFMIDVLLFWFDNHNTVLKVLVDGVKIANGPKGESALPESIRKLLLRDKEEEDHESVE